MRNTQPLPWLDGTYSLVKWYVNECATNPCDSNLKSFLEQCNYHRNLLPPHGRPRVNPQYLAHDRTGAQLVLEKEWCPQFSCCPSIETSFLPLDNSGAHF